MNSIGTLEWPVFLTAAGACAIVALVGGLLTEIGPWYEKLRFPAWRPPNWLFGPAWTLIFLLIATAATLAWQAADMQERFILVGLFALNGLLNMAWSGLFFKLRRPDWAFYELLMLWLSILSLVVFTAHLSLASALLLTPYLCWVSFAGLLNQRIVALNAPFGRASSSSAEAERRNHGRNIP